MSQSLADKLKLKITGKLTPKTDESAPVKEKKKKEKKPKVSVEVGAAIKDLMPTPNLVSWECAECREVHPVGHAGIFFGDKMICCACETKVKNKPAPKQAQDKPRTCCGTKRGKDVPHDVKCHTLVGKKKLHIGFDLPGGRFPVGTKMDKTYHEGGFWECVLVIPGVLTTFKAKDGNALQVEWKVTKKYIAWLKENAAAPVVEPVVEVKS